MSTEPVVPTPESVPAEPEKPLEAPTSEADPGAPAPDPDDGN